MGKGQMLRRKKCPLDNKWIFDCITIDLSLSTADGNAASLRKVRLLYKVGANRVVKKIKLLFR